MRSASLCARANFLITKKRSISSWGGLGNAETSFVFITLLFIAVNYSLFFCFTCTMEARRWGSASRQCFHSLLTFTISVARRRRARKSPYRLIADHKHKSRQLLITLKLIRHYYYALAPRTAHDM